VALRSAARAPISRTPFVDWEMFLMPTDESAMFLPDLKAVATAD